MNLQEIKEAVNNGKQVYWGNALYQVKKHINKKGGEDWNIVCESNGHCIGLTWTDEKTMNGKESEFYTF